MAVTHTGSHLKAGGALPGHFNWPHTSQVSVKVVQPLNLSLQFIPHCFLQSLPLGRAFHQGFIRFRYPLDLQLQLGRECEKVISLRGEASSFIVWTVVNVSVININEAN